jgi:hypothetical protein
MKMITKDYNPYIEKDVKLISSHYSVCMATS